MMPSESDFAAPMRTRHVFHDWVGLFTEMLWKRRDKSLPHSKERVFNNREAATQDELFWKVALAETEGEREHAEWAVIGWFRRRPRDNPAELKLRLHQAGVTWIFDRWERSSEQAATRAGMTVQQYRDLPDAEREAIIDRQVQEDMAAGTS